MLTSKNTDPIKKEKIYTKENQILLGEIYQLTCILTNKRELVVPKASGYSWRVIEKHVKIINNRPRSSTLKNILNLKIATFIEREGRDNMSYVIKNSLPKTESEYFNIGRRMFGYDEKNKQ